MGFIMKDFLKNIAVFVIFAILMAFAVEWILRLLPDAADSRYHSIFAYREKSGGYYTLVPGKTAKVNGVLYSVNPEGFRDKSYPALPQKGYYRIIGIGDSVMFGLGLDIQDCFLKQMESNLNRMGLPFKVEALDFGVSGINSDAGIERFLSSGINFKPHHVIIQMLLDDFRLTHVSEETKNIGIIGMVKEFLKQHFFASYFMVKKSLKQYRIMKTLPESSSLDTYLTTIYKEQSEDFLFTKKRFVELNDVCKKNKSHLTILIFPYLKTYEGKYKFRDYHDKWREFFDKNNIDYIDLIDYLKESELEGYRLNPNDMMHPNKKASQDIGTALSLEIGERIRNYRFK